ncbi:MAG: MBL fold metallo-hydrolase [Melioribacteraceae bacterium]|nr:MBL fold metallo-hydrolase [Melioribacteraceae bacterium]
MKNLAKLILFAFMVATGIYPQIPSVELKYQGHASFLMKFDNGRTVLIDYGISNVYKEYGYESPIAPVYITPDIVTYSHKHKDHCGGVLPDSIKYILNGPDSLSLDWIEIKMIPAYENSLTTADNFSYVFNYKGISIIHLGDVQALIMNVDNPLVRAQIKDLYQGKFDIAFIPIGFKSYIADQAASFAELINAKVILPMHYWKHEEKEKFIELMLNKNGSVKYRLEKSILYTYSQNKYDENAVIVLDMELYCK